MTKEELREAVRANLPTIAASVNEALAGKGLDKIEPVLGRLGHGGKLPHWFNDLKKTHTLPNLDGKTIGSVVEMLLVGVLESSTFAAQKIKLNINPAKGTDLPDLDLSVKSPSENYCTSEPFYSAYERLCGGKHDAVVLLTNYQTAKKAPPLKLQLLKWRYLSKTEIADRGLCVIARANRDDIRKESEVWGQKMFRFLAYVNQADWRAKHLLKMLACFRDPAKIPALIKAAEADFRFQNKARAEKNKDLISEGDLKALQKIATADPIRLGLLDGLDTWVVEYVQDMGRLPNGTEYTNLCEGPLDGKIGISPALQWRFNFGRIFGEDSEGEEDVLAIVDDACQLPLK